jgi:hypothetical protein
MKDFFMWCSIINGSLLILSFLIFVFAGEWVYRMHSKWFAISREVFNAALYCFLGLFKILFLVFNLVPYIVCVILE